MTTATTSAVVRVGQGKHYPVIVVGGGVSGCMAALAARREGVPTLLVETHGFPGGTLTAMGVGPMMSFHNGSGRQLIKGFPEELIQRLCARGASPGHIPDTTTYCSTVTPFDSEELKIELEQMLTEAGVDLLYHTQLADAQTEDGHIRSVLVCNKAGLTRFTADVFIDASGDGDLAAHAGVPFAIGREADGATQPLTMNLKVGGVDTNAIRAYARTHPDDFLWENGTEQGLARLERSPRLSLAGFLTAWRSARERGEVEVPRDQVLFFETANPGVVIVNTSRIQGLDATDPFALSQAEIAGRRQCSQIFSFLRRHCAGFSHAVRLDNAAKIGVRETRHIRGRHLLTAEDLLTQRQFPDVIAMGGYPIDIHSPDDVVTRTTRFPKDLCYQIPLRSLITADSDNLIVVGRCISATHEASAAVRVTPIAMAIGQGGGALAGLAAAARKLPGEVNHQVVQRRLREQGALLPNVIEAEK